MGGAVPPGKLTSVMPREEYEMEVGTDALEIHADAFDEKARVLIDDDIIATGSTAVATEQLMASTGATVVASRSSVRSPFCPDSGGSRGVVSRG